MHELHLKSNDQQQNTEKNVYTVFVKQIYLTVNCCSFVIDCLHHTIKNVLFTNIFPQRLSSFELFDNIKKPKFKNSSLFCFWI